MSPHDQNATERFSSRVADYVKYRPGYPGAILTTLRDRCGLAPASVIADIGSGTGLLTEIFLRNRNTVYGVEPNRQMRAAGEHALRRFASFTSIAATAENTTLAAGTVDFVVAGQAFHWFDRDAARKEFARILRRGGWVVLIWNERLTAASPFLTAYENLLLKYATDYRKVDHRNIDTGVIRAFYAPSDYGAADFANAQSFDYSGLKGRLLSSSYAPDASHPNHRAMIDALRALFDRHQQDQSVVIEYRTRVYYGQLPLEERDGED